MLLSLELTARQAQRVLEHARRSAARLEVAPRTLGEGQTLTASLSGTEAAWMAVDLDNQGAAVDVIALIGTYCDVQMQLDGDLYHFSTCVMDVPDNGPPGRLLLAIPESVQVVNRRRWERTKAHVLSPARVINPAGGLEQVGSLTDVSAGGVGVQLTGRLSDQELYVGDPVRVRFELPDIEPRFELPAVICSKGPGSSENTFIVNVEFQVGPADAAASEQLERLRATLFEMTIDLSEADSGCDPDES
jgi:hypothetical protein